MSTNEILHNALELPIDERAILVDILTQSLHSIDKDIEKSWLEEVDKRLKLLDKGELETIPYEELFFFF